MRTLKLICRAVIHLVKQAWLLPRTLAKAGKDRRRQNILDELEPFRFEFVQNVLSPPILAGLCESSGKQPGLFDQVDDCPANELQRSHRVVSSCCITGVASEF